MKRDCRDRIKHTYCKNCKWVDINFNICRVKNDFTELFMSFDRTVLNSNGFCPRYKEKEK